MPKPSVINRYPVQYLDLAKRFDDSPHIPIPIDLREPGEVVDKETLQKRAKAFQLELHGFRAAMTKEGMIDEYPNFDHAEIRMLKDEKSELTIGVLIVDKDRTASAEAVTKALNRLDDSSPPAFPAESDEEN